MLHDQDGKHKAQNGPIGPQWVVIDFHLELSFEIGIWLKYFEVYGYTIHFGFTIQQAKQNV